MLTWCRAIPAIIAATNFAARVFMNTSGTRRNAIYAPVLYENLGGNEPQIRSR